MVSNEKRSKQNIRLPKLIRVVLKQLGVQRGDVLGSKLTSEVAYGMSLELLKPINGKSQVRIKGEISLNGQWHGEGGGGPMASFSGVYEARFILPPDVAFDMVEKWMEDPFYRDSIMAQAVPVVNLHMYSQLEMMGLNPLSKAIGYEPKNEKWNVVENQPAVPAKRVRKKIAKPKE